MATQTVMPLALGPTFSVLPKVSLRPKYRPVFFNPINSSARTESVSGIPKEIIRSQNKTVVSLIGAGLALTLVGSPAFAGEVPWIQLSEPSNALSLPTWAIHISSVVEWITAMTLVWQYGDKSGNETWKGLSWGMVPLLGGALCACTWHFFYNSEALEVLVALQAALTVIGNATLCLAAFRIYGSSKQEQSEKL
ncbi:ycf49-like protein [Impatiens glandulifera]|uniref:ycf49-like protein n=1 Tax=Impatiens glandulifera TaxID=253017 RepID=UPI001FB04C20|nr:ycf49-like protein [Impatiens glandulifera]